MVTLTIAPPCPMLLREAGSRRGRLQGTDGRMINRRTGSGKRARNPAGSRFKPGEPLVGGLGELVMDAQDGLPLGDEEPGEVLGEVAALALVSEEITVLSQGVLDDPGELDDPWHDP